MAVSVLSNLPVLVVDDKDLIRELNRGILESFSAPGARVSVDENGTFRDMQSYAPNAIITDLNVRPTDGLSFTCTARTGPSS